ncbi:MAG: CGNR zinc finger domain-containing protein [Gemmatimonadota bacterium]|jgi:predicted RNA-binding Zn ribbon-like protein|nr:ABATE domain-containing protein [Gemmatimonadota bacterium]
MGEHPDPSFAFVGRRLWLDFVNTDAATHGVRSDVLVDFGRWLAWLVAAGVLEAGRAPVLAQRADLQPTGATAALVDARRMRAALRALAERGEAAGERPARVREAALTEVNRVLARSAGTRRLEVAGDGRVFRSFVPGGEAFAALLLPVAESAADALVAGDLARIRRCAAPGCERVFLDETKNRARRWCAMRGCGNREKQRRFRRA